MKILIATDVVLHRYDEHYFLSTAFGTILQRYAENFGKADLYLRVSTEKPSDKFICVDDYIDNVYEETLFSALIKGNKKKLKEALDKCDLIIGRCPSIIAYNALYLARKIGKPTFAEVVADPWDAYWNHSIKGKMLALYMFWATKKNIQNSDYALYVTNEFLQKRYPCKNKTIGLSDVKIDTVEEEVLKRRLSKIEQLKSNEITLVTTAAVNVRYKGQQYVIKAIPKLNKLGIKVKYILIGGGDQTYLKNIANKYKVSDQIEFAGFLSPGEIFEIVDSADIYIQPSLQEGLPRAVVEAMSRACPCIGAKTGGIPELIPNECVVKRKSAKDIVNTISILFKKETLSVLATKNFTKAKEFLDESLSNKRTEFYNNVKEQIIPQDESEI